MTILALRGIRSSPPCIASRALTNALSSRCEANASRPTTINASDHSPRRTAPRTARDVSTWKPRILFWILAIASWNILNPHTETPTKPITDARIPGSPLPSTIRIARIIGMVSTAVMSFTWSSLSLLVVEGSNRMSSPSIPETMELHTALSSLSSSNKLWISILPSSILTPRIPGTPSNSFLSPLRSLPTLLAASLGVIPTTCDHSNPGLCPRLSRTDEALDILPLETSNPIRAVPFVTEMLQDSTPGSLLTALVAFMAQSGQSIPLMLHSKSWTPSGVNMEYPSAPSIYSGHGGMP